MSAAIRIVLVNTSHPGNIGASARAMKNMGLHELVLVRPVAHGGESEIARASAASDVLGRARTVGDIGEAIGDCGLVLGATARTRSANFRVLDAREGAALLVASGRTRPSAVLFGGERSGLSNEALARCHGLIRIPAAAPYGSLNLAQAVQVVCYEILMAHQFGTHTKNGPVPATADEMRALQLHFERVMRRSGFMHDGNAGQLGPRLERLLARAIPDDGEVRILRGMLAAIERSLPAEPGS